MSTPDFLLAALAFLVPQTPPADDPATLLARASIAVEVGDLAKAKALLEAVAAGRDAALAADAKQRLAALAGRLGGDRAGAPAAGDSPLERRIADIVGVLEGPGDPKAAIEQLTWIGESALPHLTAWIANPEVAASARDSLLEAAARIGGEGSLVLLEGIAADPDDLLRRRAMEAFRDREVRVSSTRWTEVVSRFLGDRDGRTRAFALEALKNHPDAVRPRLSALARDPDPRVRETIVERFASLLSAPDAEALVRDPVAGVRRKVVNATEKGTWPNREKAALALVEDADAGVRTQAIRGAQAPAPGSPAADALEAALTRRGSDADSRLRQELAGHARRLLGARATPLLLTLSLDADESTASQAVRTLAQSRGAELRREDLPKASDTLIALARQRPFSRTDPSQVRRPTVSDQFVEFLGKLMIYAGKPEDFPHAARVFAEAPDLVEAWPQHARQILSVAGPAQVPALCDLYERSPDEKTRRVVLGVIGEKARLLPLEELEVAVAAVKRAYTRVRDDESADVPRGAAIAIASPALVEPTVESIRTLREDKELWSETIDQIRDSGKRSTEFAVPCLVAFATRPVPGDWEAYPPSPPQTAVFRLAEFPPAIAAPALENVFARSPSTGVRQSALAMLTELPGEEAQRFLVHDALRAKYPEFRMTAISALATRRVFDASVVAAVTAAAKDPEAQVREGVLRYLRDRNHPDGVPTARALLHDPDFRVRRQACTTLGVLLAKDAVPDLIEALADEDESVRKVAKEALERIRFYHEEKARWDDWYRGRGADPGEGVRKLLEALDDPSEAVRVSAMDSLGTMKSKEALPRLVEILKKGSKAEREAAGRALEKINKE